MKKRLITTRRGKREAKKLERGGRLGVPMGLMLILHKEVLIYLYIAEFTVQGASEGVKVTTWKRK